MRRQKEEKKADEVVQLLEVFLATKF